MIKFIEGLKWWQFSHWAAKFVVFSLLFASIGVLHDKATGKAKGNNDFWEQLDSNRDMLLCPAWHTAIDSELDLTDLTFCNFS